MGELSPHRVQHRCADARFPGACPQNVRETDIATSTATLYHNVFRERVNQGHLAPGVSAFGLRLAGFGSRVSSFGIRVRVGQKEGDLGERVRERGGLGVHCNRLVHPSYRGTGLQTPKPVSALQITSQKTKNERKETWGSGSGSSRREGEGEGERRLQHKQWLRERGDLGEGVRERGGLGVHSDGLVDSSQRLQRDPQVDVCACGES